MLNVGARLTRAGVNIGTGTDIWQIPIGVHMELEQLIAAGLTPAQALPALGERHAYSEQIRIWAQSRPAK